jgi:hypothetical protein
MARGTRWQPIAQVAAHLRNYKTSGAELSEVRCASWLNHSHHFIVKLWREGVRRHTVPVKRAATLAHRIDRSALREGIGLQGARTGLKVGRGDAR